MKNPTVYSLMLNLFKVNHAHNAFTDGKSTQNFTYAEVRKTEICTVCRPTFTVCNQWEIAHNFLSECNSLWEGT